MSKEAKISNLLLSSESTLSTKRNCEIHKPYSQSFKCRLLPVYENLERYKKRKFLIKDYVTIIKAIK